ncbi:hypothetical protein HN695_07190 [Candidatus Woesearchaeota archaeon]|jgi:uncharacterized membrane protein|nr:hypothetical protein [Candidatus Woesearchaeota archaeon]MBT6040964.1 hypothetical protein [Candidatus Woesearchaeota archaeon]MBT6336146.1 hypothetical protein [Candidatus Woesearchaeota archaeon]MBT7928091.1 hypothetical protein [Candidatus Woesearchaeota archaeon]
MSYGNGLGNGFTYMLITQILFFIVTIVLILWFIKSNKQDNTPLQTLNNRLVSGDITKKKYNSLLKTIMNTEEKIK